MSWFTENPWPPVFVCVVMAGLAAAWGLTRNQPRGYLGAALAVLAALGCFQFEKWIVTDREQIELEVHQLVADFTAQDEEATLDHFSPQAVDWRTQAQLALKLVKIQNIDVKDLSVKMTSGGSEAVSQFRANGRITFSGMDAGHQPSRWKLTWRREQGEWKIIDVVRLNPLKDEPMAILEHGAQ